MDSPSHANQHGSDRATRTIVLMFFGTGFVVSLLSAIVFALFPNPNAGPAYGVLLWWCILEALIFLGAGWLVRDAPIHRAVLAASWSAAALICVVSVGMGEGLHVVALGFFSALICVATVVTGVRAGLALTIFCSLWVLGLMGAEHAGWLQGADAVPTSPLAMRLATRLLLLGSSLSIGFMLARTIGRHLRAASEGEQRYRTLFERSPAGLIVHRQGRMIDCNRTGLRLLGAIAPAVHANTAGGPDAGPQDAVRALLLHGQALEDQPVGARVEPHELAMADRQGGFRVLQVSAVRVETDTGAATLSMFVDESKRRAAEVESERVRVQLESLFAASPDAIILTRNDAGGTIVMVNEEFARLTGYSAHEAVGRSVRELKLWHEPGELARFVEAITSRGMVQDIVASFRTRDGGSRQVQLSANRFEFEGVPHLAGVARDVTEHERLRSEQQAILGSAALGIALTHGTRLTRINGAGAAMFGLAPNELDGFLARNVWRVREAGGDVAAEWLDGALGRGELVDFERELARNDGSRFWCRMRGRAIEPGRADAGVVWLLEDVTERRGAQQALAKARDEAEAASRAKSAFLANTSHEIRTPMNALIGLARLAMRTTDEARIASHLQQILESAEGLADTMSDILDMSRIESGRLVLEDIEFDIRAVLGRVHEAGERAAHLRGLSCTLAIERDLPRRVMGDPVRTRQIIRNYVANALKFTASGGVVIAASGGADGCVRIAVRDTGIGIDDEVLGRLFQPFVQADSSSTRRFGGTGLGLSICRALATLMGGHAGAESIPGQGSTFWVDLPLRVVPEGATTGPPPQPAGALADPPASMLHGRHVLVAEDNAVNRIIITSLLHEWQVDVVEANDGHAALDAVGTAHAAGRSFDLVLMDVQMPGMDGFTATRLLRGRHESSTLPIIALTAGAMESERTAALACGMDAFLTKPIDAVALRHAMVDALRRTEARGSLLRPGTSDLG